MPGNFYAQAQEGETGAGGTINTSNPVWYSGTGFVSLAMRQPLVLPLTNIKKAASYHFVLAFRTSYSVTSASNLQSIPFNALLTVNGVTTNIRASTMRLSACSSPVCTYVISANPVALQPTDTISLNFSTGVLFSNNDRFYFDRVLPVPDSVLSGATFSTATVPGSPSATLHSSLKAYWNSTCTVQKIVSGNSTMDSCKNVTFALNAAFYGGCVACPCGVGAARCDQTTGACECASNVVGTKCDSCAPNSYAIGVSGCSACGCTTNALSASCNNVTGACSCPTNVVGRTCDSCTTDTYGLSPSGCTACACGAGSTGTTCNVATGQCPCATGSAGRACDSCDAGYVGSPPACTPCNCHLPGTAVNPNVPFNLADYCTPLGQCTCRANTAGLNCDTCKPGAFAKDSNANLGCTNCFCSGHGTNCTALSGMTPMPYAWTFSSPSTMGWFAESTNPLAIAFVSQPSSSNGGALQGVVQGQQVVGSNTFRFALPIDTSVVDSYGSQMTFRLMFRRFIFNTGPLQPRDVYLKIESIAGHTASFLVRSAYMPMAANTWLSVAVDITEMSATLSLPFADMVEKRAAFLRILGNVEQMSIDGVLDASQQFSYLDDFQVFYLQPGAFSPASPSSYPAVVEQCSCSAGYSGLSCESCAVGFTRPWASSGDPMDTCITCRSACSSKSDTCDRRTGQCSACERNSTGFRCEFCLPGFHLVAGECVACPSQCGGLCHTVAPADFSWQSMTTTFANAQFPSGVMCDSCPMGRTGDACEICADGYQGDPYNAGCSLCSCNGNINLNVTGNCNPWTGVCAQCTGNTAGQQCEVCAAGFYGDAINAKNCMACGCNVYGSTGATCDAMGKCTCIPGVTGAKCDTCIPSLSIGGVYKGAGSSLGPSGCVACDSCTSSLLATLDATTASSAAQTVLLQQDIGAMMKIKAALTALAGLSDRIDSLEIELGLAEAMLTNDQSALAQYFSASQALLLSNGTFATAKAALEQQTAVLRGWQPALGSLYEALTAAYVAVGSDRAAISVATDALAAQAPVPGAALTFGAASLAHSETAAADLATTCTTLTSALTTAQAAVDGVQTLMAALNAQAVDQAAALEASQEYLNASDIVPLLINATAVLTEVDTVIGAATAARAEAIVQRLAGTYSVRLLDKVGAQAAIAVTNNTRLAAVATAKCTSATAALQTVNADLVTLPNNLATAKTAVTAAEQHAATMATDAASVVADINQTYGFAARAANAATVNGQIATYRTQLEALYNTSVMVSAELATANLDLDATGPILTAADTARGNLDSTGTQLDVEAIISDNDAIINLVNQPLPAAVPRCNYSSVTTSATNVLAAAAAATGRTPALLDQAFDAQTALQAPLDWSGATADASAAISHITSARAVLDVLPGLPLALGSLAESTSFSVQAQAAQLDSLSTDVQTLLAAVRASTPSPTTTASTTTTTTATTTEATTTTTTVTTTESTTEATTATTTVFFTAAASATVPTSTAGTTVAAVPDADGCLYGSLTILAIDYSGSVNMTIAGQACVNWTNLTDPGMQWGLTAADGNACRAPDNDTRPWCYTSELPTTWGFCDVCASTATPGPTVPATTIVPHDANGCSADGHFVIDGPSYGGTTNTTTAGTACLVWDSITTPNMQWGLPMSAQNYCRAPDGDKTPWCYTQESPQAWGYCSVCA